MFASMQLFRLLIIARKFSKFTLLGSDPSLIFVVSISSGAPDADGFVLDREEIAALVSIKVLFLLFSIKLE
jgi:hypothetical protein